MTFTPSCMIALVSLVLCCGPVQPEVSLKVSPDRSHFFPNDPIVLSCEEGQQALVGWTVRRNSSATGCGSDWGSTEGVSCSITLYRGDSAFYWCQSESDISQPVLIHIHDVILQSPVHPVPEGDEATFHCLYKDQTSGKPSSNLPADFYRNGSLFRTEPTGQMTILPVSKSDEGFYKCSISGLGQSPEIWMETNSSSTSNPTSEAAEEEPLITWKQVIIKLLVFTPYFVSTLLYFSILNDRARARAAAAANARRRRDNAVVMEVAE